MLRFVLTMALVPIASMSYGQKSLFFFKSRSKTTFYGRGETITYKLKGDRTKYREEITALEDSLMVLDNYHKVAPQDIRILYVDDKTKFWYILNYKYDKVLSLLGAGYLLVDFLNTGSFNQQTLVISGALIGAGLLAKLIFNKKIHIRGKKRLNIVSA